MDEPHINALRYPYSRLDLPPERCVWLVQPGWKMILTVQWGEDEWFDAAPYWRVSFSQIRPKMAPGGKPILLADWTADDFVKARRLAQRMLRDIGIGQMQRDTTQGARTTAQYVKQASPTEIAEMKRNADIG